MENTFATVSGKWSRTDPFVDQTHSQRDEASSVRATDAPTMQDDHDAQIKHEMQYFTFLSAPKAAAASFPGTAPLFPTDPVSRLNDRQKKPAINIPTSGSRRHACLRIPLSHGTSATTRRCKSSPSGSPHVVVQIVGPRLESCAGSRSQMAMANSRTLDWIALLSSRPIKGAGLLLVFAHFMFAIKQPFRCSLHIELQVKGCVQQREPFWTRTQSLKCADDL